MSRRWRPGRSSMSLVACLALLTAACTTPGGSASAAGEPPTSGSALVANALTVPAELADAPYDQAHQVLAPQGWSVSLWARLPAARLAAWTPDGRLLVSRPKYGDVVALTPGAASGIPTQQTLL